MHTKFSSVYPPQNRVVNDLGHLEIQIRCAMNTVSLDPNTTADAGYCRAIPGLGEPIGCSALSGTPGFLYRTDEIEVVLSEDELIRLFRRDLQPQEVLSLHQQFGAFYETHDDFYDEVTGRSHQPMEEESSAIADQPARPTF